MDKYYTSETHIQILIALMKAHGVRKIVVSPGTTNVCLVGSLQSDSYFEIYSSVDERSAAYIACGLAAESGEPVALSCTGATASRNYVPGLTEAFYRKLPVLAITSTQHEGRIGQNIPQVLDRRVQMNDLVKLSVSIPVFDSDEDRWAYTVQINRALLELRRNGGGPVHINLATTYSKDFSKKTLPNVKVIKRYNLKDTLPDIPEGKVAIFVGDHRRFSEILTQAIDEFCKKYNGVVLCDHTSNYRGKYRVLASIVTEQTFYSSLSLEADLVVDIGNVSGAYIGFKGKQVWRVNPDGEIRDTYRKLTGIFDMDESDFFETYNSMAPMVDRQMSYYDEWAMAYKRISEKIPELPFSNLWIAQHTAHCLPDDSILYLAILNTLRSWNFFETPVSVTCYSNTGGFGIDGGVSTLVGMSLVDKNKLYFGVVGDLGFFYDMNVLGNRHIGNNIRIMIINNGRGTEFRNYSHPAACFGEDADPYMAAAGHYGNKSITLVRHYAEDLGFEYLSASNKEEYLEVFERFLTPELTDKSMVLEVFTDSKDESDALKIMHNIEVSSIGTAKKIAKDVLGEKGVEVVKKFLNR